MRTEYRIVDKLGDPVDTRLFKPGIPIEGFKIKSVALDVRPESFSDTEVMIITLEYLHGE